MYEVEVKLAGEHTALRAELRDQGATRLGVVTQMDTYFDAPTRSFADTDEALRLRRESIANGESTAIITYKGPKVEDRSKTRPEHETVIEDLDEMRSILEAVDFRPVATVEKERERYEIDGFIVSLDTVTGLGEFVEIETTVSARSKVDPTRDRAFEVLERLSLDPSAQIRRSYLELLLASG